MRTDVNACHSTQEYTDTVIESALVKDDSGRKIPCHTRELSLHQWCAGLTFYKLNYIPTLGSKLFFFLVTYHHDIGKERKRAKLMCPTYEINKVVFYYKTRI